MITQELLKEYFKYDPDAGIFTSIKKRNGVKVGSIAGTYHTYLGGKSYVKIGFLGKTYKAHRLAWLYMAGEFPQSMLDHIDGDGTNNKFKNLRISNSFDNAKNARKRSDNTSGYTGISWSKNEKRWHARISHNGKRICIGYFRDLHDAVRKRKAHELMYGYSDGHGSDRPAFCRSNK